jgi:nicotinamide phosphoribosyltransferase
MYKGKTMFKFNPLTALDFYKTGHMPQYPEGTEFVYSNLTARSNKHFDWVQSGTGYVVLWGLQGLIQEILVDGWNEGFFKQSKTKCVSYFKRRMQNAVAPIDTKHIEELHDLQFLPIKIKSLPEGTLVPIGMPVFTIINTDKKFFWLTNLLETVISSEVWKPITTATIAYEYKKLCLQFAEDTCDNTDHIQFQCHDFSMRGMSGWHDAARSSTGHLLSFSGTDTVPAIDYLEQYYGANSGKELVGASVPATEHSVLCMSLGLEKPILEMLAQNPNLSPIEAAQRVVDQSV